MLDYVNKIIPGIEMNRGLIQTPILIAILVVAAVASAYYLGTTSKETTQDMRDVPAPEGQQDESYTITTTEPPVETSSANKGSAAPVSQNLDSTCLSFYEKMKFLDVPPVKETPVYTQAELKAIEMAGKGEYDPALPSAQAKVSVAESNYQNAIRANAAQKQDLATKYAFCYEYLAKTYGFVIN